ncbi:MAG: alpha/beta hydrolase [Paludibacter sp.]|nr:alpha/beta hydrolase [Paludibacter sp.]
MIKIFNVFFLIIFFANVNFAQTESFISLRTLSGTIYGIMQMPDNKGNIPLAILVPDCKTDNYFDEQLQNQALKTLADSLAKRGIATLRYDKRGTGRSLAADRNGINLTIESYVADLNGWINRYADNTNFSEIVLVGHGEGALVAIICAIENKNVKKYVSLEGAGLPRADILRVQMQMQFELQPQLREIAEKYIDKLSKGEIIDEFVPQRLSQYFPPNLNHSFISWFKYNPQTEIAKLTIPILIVQGSADAQITVSNANFLAQANTNARKIVIENMNHIFRACNSTHQLSQYAANCRPYSPIKSELCSAVADFILKGK